MQSGAAVVVVDVVVVGAAVVVVVVQAPETTETVAAPLSPHVDGSLQELDMQSAITYVTFHGSQGASWIGPALSSHCIEQSASPTLAEMYHKESVIYSRSSSSPPPKSFSQLQPDTQVTVCSPFHSARSPSKPAMVRHI